jgi:hypothetical protein
MQKAQKAETTSVAYIPGLCSVTFRQKTIEEVISLSTACGIRAIEWGSDIHVPVGDISTAQRVREMCERANVAPASYGTYLRTGIANSKEHLASIMETASALGAQNIRVWGGPRGVASADIDNQTWHQAIDELRTTAELAAEKCLKLSLEFHADTLVDTAPAAVKLLRAVNHPALFTKWQPTPGISKQESIEQLEMIQPWLSYIDVFARDKDRKRHPLSRHMDLWSAVFQRARPAQSWDSPVFAMIEFVKDDSQSSLQDDVATLEKILRSCQDQTG